MRSTSLLNPLHSISPLIRISRRVQIIKPVHVYFFISTLLTLSCMQLLSSAVFSQTIIPFCYLSVKYTVSNSYETRDKITVLYILKVWSVTAARVCYTQPVSLFVQTDGYCNFSKLDQFPKFQQPTMIKWLYMFLYIN
jgi:hypothetical protein